MNPKTKPLWTRRKFLLAQAVIPFGLAGIVHSLSAQPAPSSSKIKIEKIEIFPLRYPMAGYFKFFAGPRGEAGRAAVIIKITADNGTVGWGESVPLPTWSSETLESAIVVLRHYFVPTLIGHDPTDLVGAQQVLNQSLAPNFSTAMPITRAGLDIALHDLAGKIAKKPLHEIWGRPRGEALTLSWTVNARTIDEVEPLMNDGYKRGYRNFNIKVAPNLAFDLKLARRVRELAPDGFLWADANCGYSVEEALEAAPALADAGVDILEAPVRPNQISGYQKLKKQGALPLYMDEGVISPVELAEFIRLEMLDGVAQKPARCGGLFSCREQIELLHRHNLDFLGSGLTDPDISLAATLCLYAAYGLQTPAALNGPQFLTESVLEKPLQVTDGKLEIPTRFGLGIEVDEGKVRHLSRTTFDPASL